MALFLATYELIGFSPPGDGDGDDEWELFVEVTPAALSPMRLIEWLGGCEVAKPFVWRFCGDCTVWHDAETFERCSTPMEMMLADFWRQAKHQHRAA